MKRFLLFSILFFSIFLGKAQHYHFVYLQSDNAQPFYIKVGDKIYSSSQSGYTIIPKLLSGEQSIWVGFPKNEWPQQKFNISISGSDMGFLLKKDDSKGWYLFNLQTLTTLNASINGKNPEDKAVADATPNSFTSTLADVVNTPSLKVQENAGQNKPAKTDVISENQKLENKSSDIVLESKKEAQKSETPVFPAVRRQAVNNGPNSFTYIVLNDGNQDTIVIDFEEELNTKPEVKVGNADNQIQPAPKTSADSVESRDKMDEKGEKELRFISLDLQSEVADSNKPNSAPKPITEKEVKMINSDCKQIASDNDFFKLRKKMSAQKSDEEMVQVAKKQFKHKCFSTEQIKNLSLLFLNDEGKYHFFDASYPFTHNSNEFKSLESQLNDPYYINRFRSMVNR